MKILVTGGAGFIASNIVDRYIELGHDVIVVDDLSTGLRENVNPSAKLIEMNITDSAVIDLIKHEKPNIINHHAAQMDVRISVENPVLDANINIIGLINLLKAASETSSLQKFIFASSGGVAYGENDGNRPFKETDTLNPMSPYGVSKISSEYYIKCFYYNYGLNYTILRYSNVYGKRQLGGEAGVIAIFIKQLLKDKQVLIFGDGNQKRDYIYVEDIVKANELILENGKNEIFNIGTSKTLSVNKLYELISEIMNKDLKPIYEDARKGELFCNYLDYSKAKEILGWYPEYDVNTGLENTVEYFKQKNV